MPEPPTRLRHHHHPFRSARRPATTVETVPGFNRLMALGDDELAELGLRRSDIEAWGAGRIMCIRPLTERVLRILEQSKSATAAGKDRDRALPHHAA